MLEAVEGNIEVQEIANPDTDGIEYEKEGMLHMTYGRGGRSVRSRLGNPRHRAWPGRESVSL